MKEILDLVEKCELCKNSLKDGVRPVISVSEKSKILIIGQAPGLRVHQTGIPWDDPSGRQLRNWLEVSEDEFYDVSKFAILPIGFCYPGKGKSGDLPPRKECAPMWHQKITDQIKDVQLTLLIGKYAQDYYLKEHSKKSLTENVRTYNEYLPRFLPLPHPSPRNRFWMTKNPWFAEVVLPVLKSRISELIK